MHFYSQLDEQKSIIKALFHFNKNIQKYKKEESGFRFKRAVFTAINATKVKFSRKLVERKTTF